MELPSTLTPILGIPIPDFLEQSLGYQRDRRYVAFWWDIYSDTVNFQDDRITLSSDGWTAWMLFIKHPTIFKYIQNYNLGSSDRLAEYGLLIDTKKRRVYVGKLDDIHAFFESIKDKMIDPIPPVNGLAIPRGDIYERLECWLDTLPR